MKYRLFLFFILLSLEYTKVFSQTEWVLDNSSESRIYTSDIDSITYTNENGEFSHNLWLGGRIVEKREIKEGDVFEPKEVSLKYDYCTFEEDGMDGIMTTDGNFAILQYTPDSTGYVLTCGSINDGAYDYILFDTLGYVKGIKTRDNKIYSAIYSPDELWLIDSDGKITAEIPYSKFNSVDNVDAQARPAVGESFTRHPVYQGLSICNTVFGYCTNLPLNASLDLLHAYLRNHGNRNGDFLGRLIKLGFDFFNPIAWADALDTMIDIFFFGNVMVTARDAIQKDIFRFNLPCEVRGLTYNTEFFRSMGARYEELMRHSFTLNMTTQTATIPHQDQNSQHKEIEREGLYDDFTFDFQEIQTLYDYEPSLTLDATVKRYLSPRELAELQNAVLAVNPDAKFEIPQESVWYTMNYNRTVYGNRNSLVTGSVSSTIEKVENEKSRTADVICSFSSVPKGAECIVSVSQNESEISFLYHGEPGKESQTLSVDNLSMNTSYVASCYIKHHGRTYPGIKSVEFQTTGPSGKVISIDPETITTSSATVKCEFNGIESDVECGIVVQSSEQTLTFSASSKGGEQLITLSGLEPGTQYRCYAFVRSSNYYRRQRTSVSFTTNVPGIEGTWNCVEEYDWRPYPSAAWQTKTRSYTLTLHSDGSIIVNGLDYNYIGGSWDYSSSGLFTATGHVFATQTQNSWDRFEGTVDSVKNPKRITGVRYRGNMNMVVNVEDVAGRITMTR